MTLHTIAQMQLILRLSLGLIFIFSALIKLRDPAAFVRGVLDNRILPPAMARSFGWSLPFAEFGVALLLLSGFLPSAAAAFALLLLVCFALALGINAARGRTIPCYCFGATANGHIGWHSLVRDVALFPVASWLLWSSLNHTVPLMPVALSALPLIIGIATIGALSYALLIESLNLFAGAAR